MHSLAGRHLRGYMNILFIRRSLCLLKANTEGWLPPLFPTAPAPQPKPAPERPARARGKGRAFRPRGCAGRRPGARRGARGPGAEGPAPEHKSADSGWARCWEGKQARGVPFPPPALGPAVRLALSFCDVALSLPPSLKTERRPFLKQNQPSHPAAQFSLCLGCRAASGGGRAERPLPASPAPSPGADLLTGVGGAQSELFRFLLPRAAFGFLLSSPYY